MQLQPFQFSSFSVNFHTVRTQPDKEICFLVNKNIRLNTKIPSIFEITDNLPLKDTFNKQVFSYCLVLGAVFGHFSSLVRNRPDLSSVSGGTSTLLAPGDGLVLNLHQQCKGASELLCNSILCDNIESVQFYAAYSA